MPSSPNVPWIRRPDKGPVRFTGRDPLFVPEAPHPQDFHAGPRTDTPERRLLCAVFERALLDLNDEKAVRRDPVHARQERLAQQSAWEWVASTDRTWPCAFEVLCSEFGFDAEQIRAALHIKAPARVVREYTQPQASRLRHTAVSKRLRSPFSSVNYRG